MKIDLSTQVILLTGGSRGIGKAIAEALGKTGATVAIHFHRQGDAAHQLAEGIGNGAKAFQADLGKNSDCIRLIEEVQAHYGRIDALVNNAGIALPLPTAAAVTEFTHCWEKTLQVNLQAPALLCHQLIPQWISAGKGRIVHVASRAAFRGDTPEYMAYAASKAGMVALSRSIARGYGKKGIVSFVVAPGFTRTDMAQDFIDTYGEAHAINDLALSELTLPEDIAPTVIFLLSGLMDHATGCSIDINAGSYVR